MKIVSRKNFGSRFFCSQNRLRKRAGQCSDQTRPLTQAVLTLIFQTKKLFDGIENATRIGLLIGFEFRLLFGQNGAAFFDNAAETFDEFGVFFENRFQTEMINF